jgi:copper oxidase (laccase) domain-containing protein
MRLLGSDPVDIKAAIGPCIGVNSYEVDDAFKSGFHGGGDCFRIINMRLHFDLPKYCFNRLLESGISGDNIETLNIDTFVDEKNYFSYRLAGKRSSGVCGRQISAIVLIDA